MKKNKILTLGIIVLCVTSSIGLTTMAKNNPIENVKKNVLMSEAPASEIDMDDEAKAEERQRIAEKEEEERIAKAQKEAGIEKKKIDEEPGEEKKADELIKIAKEAIETKFGVELNNNEYEVDYGGEGVIEKSIDYIGSAKICWNKKMKEDSIPAYGVIVTKKGRIKDCVKFN